MSKRQRQETTTDFRHYLLQCTPLIDGIIDIIVTYLEIAGILEHRFKSDIWKVTSLVTRGNDIISGSIDKTVRVWNKNAKTRTIRNNERNTPTCLVVTNNNTLWMGTDHGSLEYFDWTGRSKKVRDLTIHVSFCLCDMVYLHTLDMIVCYFLGDTIEMWNCHSKKLIRSMKHGLSITSLSGDGNNCFAVGCFSGQITKWNASTNVCEQTFKDSYAVVNMALGNKYLFSVNTFGMMLIWNCDDGSLVKVHSTESTVLCMIKLRDDTVACGHLNGTIIIWSPKGIVKRTIIAHRLVVSSLAAMNDGTLVSGSEDNSIKMWT